ncbi:alpha/beta hydrolase [Bordetella genomosp. 4]|uniref:Alpha/beta hydrolase n=1 Tax=Bordetella genomosp. 4 TaxID=463044 RepID=A0A261UT90_9BORD|nr:alpha/beta hydrolase [Bordetella genomosp. 4]OZI42392.1 alpha/beta hydrolase [Bordetella genomosp. 4]OZI64552.1 alpha/beta hydrolase [Bordetella genomosp. 4]
MTEKYSSCGTDLVFDQYYVPTDDVGIEIHVRNKRPASMTRFRADRTIVIVHGATFSSGSLYDVPFNGMSFLDFLAAAGYDVHALDVRGYGHSSRPSEMESPADESAPVIGTDIGVHDLGVVVDHVRALRGLERVCVFGMSWGGTVAGAYTSRNADKVEKLALLAPQWLSDKPIPIDSGGPLGAYRLVPVRESKGRWLSTAPEHGRATLIPDGWFEQWADFTLAEDPWSRERTPNLMRASNGPIQDIRDYWAAGRKYYNPAEISAPVLLIHGEWDIDVPIDLAQALFLELKNAAYRKWVEIGEATHLVLLEKNRLVAYKAIRDFFDEDYTPEIAESQTTLSSLT